jgi:hypothetical protein
MRVSLLPDITAGSCMPCSLCAQAWLLGPERREQVADAANAAILAEEGNPASMEVRESRMDLNMTGSALISVCEGLSYPVL